MSAMLEVIYDSSDAENLTEIDEFTAQLDEFEEEHPEIEIQRHDWSILDEEERDELRERFVPGYSKSSDDDDEDDFEDFDDEEEEYGSNSYDDDEEDDGFDDEDDAMPGDDEEDIRIPMMVYEDRIILEGYYPGKDEFKEIMSSALETEDNEETDIALL